MKKQKINSFFKKNKVQIFIISKLGSERLKDKIKINIKKSNITEIFLKRITKIFPSNLIKICTSGYRSKNFFLPFKNKYNVEIFVGENKNVLSRILKCMKKNNLKHFVRVTGDNPFTDLNKIITLVKMHVKNQNDYTYTTSLPVGLRSEVFSYNALLRCEKNIVDPNSTEYLTYYFLREDLYKIQCVKFKKYCKIQDRLSISIDYRSDLNLASKILQQFNNNIHVSTKKIVNFLKNNSKPVKLIKSFKLKTNKYDVRYKSDKRLKKVNFIN